MANQEQLERLLQGVEAWNAWRWQNIEMEIDLSNADLRGVDLMEVNLSGANLAEANLTRGNLHLADLAEAYLVEANLTGIHLYRGDLGRANLAGAHLFGADLTEANLKKANLEKAYLRKANLEEARLQEANLSGATLGQTLLVNLDLSETKGLDEVQHEYPSHVSTDTIQQSKGKIPAKFLRGCGLSDWEIESAKLYQPGLSVQDVDNILYCVHDLRVGQSLQINPLFISYSHADSAFVDKMEKHLDDKGIRFWRDIHDATAGRLEKVVDKAIRQNPIELLILSENSVKSDWVEHEARTARELEKELGRDVLCPIALDEAWKKSKWPERLREQIMEYHILDFSKWKDEAEFAKMFRKLVDGLDLFYKEK